MVNAAAQPSEATLRAEVYDIVRQIPRGRVLTYGRIAALCGWPNHSRLVGRIMRTAPDADLPCHRVVNASGRLAPHYPPDLRRHPPHPLRQGAFERISVESLILGGHRQLVVLLSGVRDGGVFIPG